MKQDIAATLSLFPEDPAPAEQKPLRHLRALPPADHSQQVALIPAAAPSGTRLLPMLVAGKGETRLDCRHEPDCSMRFVKTTLKTPGRNGKAPHMAREIAQAHCPNGCPDYSKLTRDERLQQATVKYDNGTVFPSTRGL